jgi:prophage regulatory protein
MKTLITPAAAAATEESLLRLPQVLALIPVSRAHWWKGIADGKFPTGIKLSERVTCWKSGDIQNLISSLK